MASLRASGLLCFPSSNFRSRSGATRSNINAAISMPPLPRIRFPFPKKPVRRVVDQELNLRDGFTARSPVEKIVMDTTIPTNTTGEWVEKNAMNVTCTVPDEFSTSSNSTAQLYAILEAVADRVEMHQNIGEQRNNWNSLLLNSINMITLTATTMAGVAATGAAETPLLAMKLSSALLFSAAAGMLLIMNKIQPSQLAEEQRNATRLFKQRHSQIQTTLALGDPDEQDVNNAMEKVLALDKAYPLPLLGKMIEKFPEKFEPAVWWPTQNDAQRRSKTHVKNGWSQELVEEMDEVIQVLRTKDAEDYMRLGNLALKLNKALAISGPLLTGVAAVGSAFVGNGSWAGMVAVTAGALASAVNTLEHGGQVGMVVEMYRNCAGFFTLMEESMGSAAEEGEEGEMFEMKVALKLGRSLSQLRHLAQKSSSSRIEGAPIDEFASKLF